MTMPASARKLAARLPSANEREVADQLRQIIASSDQLTILDDNREQQNIVLAPALADTLLDLLRYFSTGKTVTLVPVSQMLTTQQAADILNVSRPYLIKLLDEGVIAHDKVGRHRRIKAEELFAYKETRDHQRREALEELTELDGQYL